MAPSNARVRLGLILPFTIIPIEDSLERYPQHRTAHAAFLSTNTISTHLRHIYAKLGVLNRAEAGARARGLRLLAPSHRRH